MKMKYLKLFEAFKTEPLVYKIPGIALTTLGYKRGKEGFEWSWLPIGDKYKSAISDIFKDIQFDFVELDNQHQWLALHFTKPKRFEECQVSMHEYDPADVYYTVRISMFDDDWWSFNWFGQVYATQEHMLNYYKNYPHFGPGGERHTYINSQGEERLNYQPAMYKGFQPLSAADSFAATDRKGYLCDQFDSLETLLIQFRDFLLDERTLRFETNYPDWDQEQLRVEDL